MRSRILRSGVMVLGVLSADWAALPAAEAPAGMAPKTVEQLAQLAKPSICVVTFQGRDGDRQGLGTGFIVDPNGLIATNLHVIGEARPIQVQLADKRQFDVVSVLATDRQNDLALLKIDATELPALALGDSDQLQEGQSIVVLGNPLGLERSIVSGVLSSRRDVEGRAMLQIAIPIEKGNSGGPVLDAQGRVHGVVTLKSQKTENLGFAVPINALKPLIAQPNPVPMAQWLTIGVLDPEEWLVVGGGRWRQRAGRMVTDGRGGGFGGRCLCLAVEPAPEIPFEVAVTVKFDPWDGAAGLVFHADGADKHYGFYPSNGELRLSRFDGPDVFAWTVLAQTPSPKLRKDAWNTLKVRVEADVIRCFINGEPVIESRDAVFKSGKVGLCKFRQTQAEFKQFQVGATVYSGELSPEIAEQVKQATAALSLDRTVPLAQVDALLTNAPAAIAALEQETSELLQRAELVRQFAVKLHDRRVRAAMATVISVPDEQIDLVRGALVIAQADNPELDVDGYAREVDRIARRVRGKLADNASETDKLAALKRDLFEEHGFHGSRADYVHRSNSYLNEVLDDREGLPITLSVLFMELARKLDVNVAGLPFPGHFVVRHLPKEGEGAIIDVFDRGKDLTLADAKAKIAEVSEQPWDDAYLQPASRRAILVRMLRNLFGDARNLEEAARMLRYIELVLVLQPDSAMDRYYRSALHFQTGQYDLAREDVEWLQQKQPDDVPAQAIEDLSRAITRALTRGQ